MTCVDVTAVTASRVCAYILIFLNVCKQKQRELLTTSSTRITW